MVTVYTTCCVSDGSAAVYPNVCSMKLVAVSDASEREVRVDFWDNVYGQRPTLTLSLCESVGVASGFKMSCMKREILREASVQCMEESTIISSTHTLKVCSLTPQYIMAFFSTLCRSLTCPK